MEATTYTLAAFIADIMSMVTNMVVPGVNALVGLITGNPIILASFILLFISFCVGLLMISAIKAARV